MLGLLGFLIEEIKLLVISSIFFEFNKYLTLEISV